MTAARWLSEPAESLVQEIVAMPGATHCEVLIVGSGYGGAVAAARLAGARRRDDGGAASVYVLERGQEYLPGMFPATFAELPGHVRFSLQDGRRAHGRAEGLFDVRLGGDVNVLLGNGLGGGSLINAAVMERPTADAFEDPRWPEGIDLVSLADAYKKAERMLDAQQMPGSVPKLDSLRDTAAAMDAPPAEKARIAIAFADEYGRVRPTPAGVQMQDCLRCGDCVSGCNHQAKQSLDVNYLALARANGARLFCGATVQRLRLRGGVKGYAVEFQLTDPTKARADRELAYVVHARRVILAAGTLGSTEILMRSQGVDLPIATAALGHHFSGNGDLIAVAHRQRDKAACSAREGDPPAQRHVGPTITGLVRHRVDGLTRPVVFEEFAIPAPLRRLFGEVVATTSALHGLARTDRSVHHPTECIDDPLAISDDALDHTPVYGMMGDDGAAGEIELAPVPADAPPPLDAQVRIKWKHAGKVPVFAKQIAALRLAHERHGGRGGQVLPNPLWRPMPPFAVLDKVEQILEALADRNLHGPPTTVHPLGGCPMGHDKTRGVVDRRGCVYAQAGDEHHTMPGLAVLDGAIVPAALGINPALTIAALAEHAVPSLADEWRLDLREADTPQSLPRPVRRDLKQPRPPSATKIKLQERMTGRLVIDQKSFDAGVVAEFEPVDASTLRRLPRVIEQRRVTLKFTDAKGSVTHAHCQGHASILLRERSSLLSRVLRSADLVRRKLQRFNTGDLACRWIEVIALCSHLGQVRLICYDWTVVDAEDGAPVKPGDHLRLTKRIEFNETGNPWRQLSEGRLERIDLCSNELGRLVLDPSFFVEQLAPLLHVESQQDQPNALGDIVELGLWVLRIVLRIHLLNFLPLLDVPPKNTHRLPGTVGRVKPDVYDLEIASTRHRRDGQVPPKLRLTRYRPRSARADKRPVLLIHGYGASGSTFAHPSIGVNLVHALNKEREVWVVDLRTSIGLDQYVYWSFDTVATEDIPLAIDEVLERSGVRGDGKVDVVAHCIGAAMFSVAVLKSDDLHRKIGVAVLSQVGPLLRMSAINRFRGFVASYLRQFIGSTRLTVDLEPFTKKTLLIDGLLATYPYPDDDREAERLKNVPGFPVVRHRADAIFGQTMQLVNIGDDTLGSLNSIYGWVMAEGLAQTIHYAREQLLTDTNGLNQVVSFDTIAERLKFPLLMLHGRKNALFDWRGSYDTIWLLTSIFDKAGLPREPGADNPVGAGARWLRVFDTYGHQDTLIGQNACRDVFPHIVEFLDRYANEPGATAQDAPLAAERPAIGPALGRVSLVDGELVCRIALRPPLARASTLAVVFVPAHRAQATWRFAFDKAVLAKIDREQLIDAAMKVRLVMERVPHYDGFAVVTVHNDLPTLRGVELFGEAPVDSLFSDPPDGPSAVVLEKVGIALDARSVSAQALDLAVMHLDPAWIRAVQRDDQPAQASLCLALASCHYPPGLVDRIPAQRSLERLAQRVAELPLDERPQLLLQMGDQVYVDATAGLFDPSGADLVDNAYRLNFTLPALRRVTKALPTCPVLDDHEVQDNWEPENLSRDAQANPLAPYVRYQHKLIDDRRAPPFDYKFAPAGFPLFVLDARSKRQRRVLRATDGAALLAEASIHAPDDLAPLFEWLRAAPPDVPKFIVTSIGVFPFPHAALGASGERLGLDDWSGYPRSQFALLEFIRDQRIGNVVLLAGDRHMSSASSLWIESSHGASVEVVAIVSSGLHAPWPFANGRADEFVLDGPIELTHAGRNIRGTLVTAAAGTSDGFAIVRVQRINAGRWHIEARLDLADGKHVYERTLGDANDRRWSPR